MFGSYKDMYQTIDNTCIGNVKWQSFTVKYTGDVVANPAPWMHDEYDVVWNMLANPKFTNNMDLQPFHEYNTADSTQQWQDFMSGDWAWHQAVRPGCLGLVFIPIILGSDKTTVSVAAGQNDYYPLYLSIGNIHNNICWAHHNGIYVCHNEIAIPDSLVTWNVATREYASKDEFHRFQCQPFHSSLGCILKTLKPGMAKPEVTLFGDGHYWCVIYGLGPYIADYEECLAYCNNLDDDDALHHCHDHAEMLIAEFTLDALWDKYGIVGELVPFTNDFVWADIYELITPDILHQIIKGMFKDHLVEWVEKYLHLTHVAPFPGLHCFPQGQHFKQWTGNDSKALIKVYLPTIKGHVPSDIVHTFCTFLEFCYLDLDDLDGALARFYQYCEIFKTIGIITTFSLPHQHSMKHYKQLIQLFGAPNRLCSSITESKHVKAIKKPYCHTNKYHTLGQMLFINQCLDKLAASQLMMIVALADELHIPNLLDLVQAFLDTCDPTEIPYLKYPGYEGRISIHNSAISMFYALSDLSGIGNPELQGMHGMDIAHMLCFFSFKSKGICYPYAVMQWFDHIWDGPDEATGMWMVWPGFTGNHQHNLAIIHVDTVFHAAHLIPILGQDFVP
ncbi:hypothetical protein EDD17DRAFT_1776455 [Pisolithus thermaeus]|nr:hypothetical protein EDD17DRAFT_1776455 [Pisolithus thermaeus]